MKSQHELVLNYLKKHKNGMTALDAHNIFGIMQMPKRIFILKKQGWKIKSVPESGKNRFGATVHYCRYFLEEAK